MIILEESRGASYPVLKRRQIGEKFVGGVVNQEWRDMTDDEGKPVFKDDGKTPVKQLVVYLLTRESTMVAGLAGNETVPQRGDVVRIILDRGGLAQWFRAKEAAGIPAIGVGHLVAMNTTHGIRYAQNKKELGQLTTNEEITEWETSAANIRGTERLGRRGDLAVKDADESDPFFDECEATHKELFAVKRERIALEDPFPGPATAGVGANASATDLF